MLRTRASRDPFSVPPEAALDRHARLIAALSIGDAVIYLQRPHPQVHDRQSLDTALAALAAGDVARARGELQRFSTTLAASPDGATTDAMRCRVAAMVIVDALQQYADYFGSDIRLFAFPPSALQQEPHAIR